MVEWNVAAVAAKALLYASCLTAGGGVIFLAIFGSSLREEEHAGIVRFVRLAAVFGLCVVAARMLVLSGMLGDSVSSMWDWSVIQIVLDSSEGTAAAVRAVGLVIVAAFSFATGLTQALALLGALLVVLSFALTGHTGSLEMGEWPRALLVAHLLAVSYWIGALAPLFMVSGSADFSRVGTILRRFGDIAFVVVSSLVAAGVILALLMLGSLEALLSSSYGRLILLKVTLVAGLLSLAALNKLRLTSGVLSGSHVAVQNLRRSIIGEMTLAGAILTVTAAFTTVVGPPGLE